MSDDIEGKKKMPVSVDVGVKASLEVKAEIPPATTGRLVDAITDVIRPFTERRGLKADLIRLQREDVAFQIAKKARDRAEIEQIELHPVPTKFLVPFLEKSSLEDIDSEMQDRWAALLLATSKEYQAAQLTFIDILSRMSSRELTFLEEVCFSYKSFPETSYPGGHFEANLTKLESNKHMLAQELNQEQISQRLTQLARQFYDNFVQASPLVYGGIMYAGVSLFSVGKLKHFGTYNFYSEFGSSGSLGFRSLEILERERLVNIQRIKRSDQGGEIGYFDVTYLGVHFVRDCSPQTSEMAARRPKPIPARH